ncbi:MAG: hypothetical protein ACFWTM_03305 [Mitsuokella multacida]
MTAQSHPSWVRGLKFNESGMGARFNTVAPFVGAWIEIPSYTEPINERNCRTLRGCVD